MEWACDQRPHAVLESVRRVFLEKYMLVAKVKALNIMVGPNSNIVDASAAGAEDWTEKRRWCRIKVDMRDFVSLAWTNVRQSVINRAKHWEHVTGDWERKKKDWGKLVGPLDKTIWSMNAKLPRCRWAETARLPKGGSAFTMRWWRSMDALLAESREHCVLSEKKEVRTLDKKCR